MSAEKSVQEIVDLASAFYGSAVLFAAIEVDVFGILAKGGSLHADEVAKSAVCDVRGMRILLDACVAEGLLKKEADGRYSNTAAAAMALVKGGQADLTKAIRYNRDVYPAWGRLVELVRTGRPVERPELHLGDDQARTKSFAASMYGRAMGIGRSVVPMLELDSSCERVLDLAGGPAAYAILIANEYPQVRQVVSVDLPAISEEAKGFVALNKLETRIECRAGDYHKDSWEQGAYDAVTIFGALHQESPEDICLILKKSFCALKSGGRIYVLDMMTDSSHTNPAFSALFAVNMALTTKNGWVFADTELHSWMKEAGFVEPVTTHVPPPMPHWLVTAKRG